MYSKLRSNEVGSGTMLQAARSRVRFLMRSFDFLNLPSAVGTATGYGLNDQVVRVRVPVESRIFHSLRRSDWL
jgi:hypothetical protein